MCRGEIPQGVFYFHPSDEGLALRPNEERSLAPSSCPSNVTVAERLCHTEKVVGARTGASRKGRSKANTASPVTPCGKSQVLKGHDFSRAVSDSKQTWALAPEGWFFGIFDFHHGLVSILYAIRYSKIGPVAQRLEQGTHNPLVRGSNPCRPTRISHG